MLLEKMERFGDKLKSLKKNRSFRYGLPFLLAILGGSFGLKEFAQIRLKAFKEIVVAKFLRLCHFLDINSVEKHR